MNNSFAIGDIVKIGIGHPFFAIVTKIYGNGQLQILYPSRVENGWERAAAFGWEFVLATNEEALLWKLEN